MLCGDIILIIVKRSDINHGNAAYREAIKALYSVGVIVGFDDGTLQPDSKITRAQIATILYRLTLPAKETFTDANGNEKVIETPYVGVPMFTAPSSNNPNGKTNSAGKQIFQYSTTGTGYYTITFDKSGFTPTVYLPLNGSYKEVLPISGANKFFLDGGQTVMISVTETGKKVNESFAMNISCVVPKTVNAPVNLHFDKVNQGNQYYLFDDNHERIRYRDLANHPNTPTTIAHFEELGEGTYTFFGYHNRQETRTEMIAAYVTEYKKGHGGDEPSQAQIDAFSATLLDANLYPENTEQYYDPVFWNPTGKNGSVTVTKLGYSTAWGWEQTWADFSGEDVFAPVIYTGVPNDPEPVKDINFPAHPYSGYTNPIGGEGTKTWFSDLIGHQVESIKVSRVVWIMMEFTVNSGTVNFDTLAYSDPASKASMQLTTMKKGDYEWDEQYKGKANNAPRVHAEMEYYLDNSIPKGVETVLPVKVANQFFPSGHVLEFNQSVFTTNANSYNAGGYPGLGNWQTADDSNMIEFRYKDSNGKLWTFNNFTDDKTGLPLPVSPSGPDTSKSGGNFANFGVTNSYTITLHNMGAARNFKFMISSEGRHVYDYKVYHDGVLVQTQSQLLKAVYFNTTAVSDENLVDIELPEYTTVKIELNLTMTTGCNGTIHNFLSVY